jgi:hypothetical protein
MLRAFCALTLSMLAACSVDAPAPAPDAQAVTPDAQAPAPDAQAPAPDGAPASCVTAPLAVEVTPRTSPPMAVGAPAEFDIAVTSEDSAQCAASHYELRTRINEAGLEVTPSFNAALETGDLFPGQTKHLTITAVADAFFAGRTVTIPFDLAAPESTTPAFAGSVALAVAEPQGCHVSAPKELMITDLSVVEDPVRAAGDGAWTFKRLVEDFAPTPDVAPAMVEALLASLATPRTINGFVVPARSGVRAKILDRWPRLPGGALDLRAAPLRLLAIVNRFDVRNPADGDAGEGRFIFGFLDDGLPLDATIIFEYKLPAATAAEVAGWARAFHALGALPFSEEYNAALEAVTERFAGRGVVPSRPNGSALGDIRTNEIAFGDDGNWELREFALAPGGDVLEPRPVGLTPDLGLNGSDALARFVDANAAAILLDRHTVPELFEDRPFRAGASLNDASVWAAPGIIDNEARHHLAMNTCNGCHASETATNFLHVHPRLAGAESHLSSFLRGTTVLDPITQEHRTFNELARRGDDLLLVVCP